MLKSKKDVDAHVEQIHAKIHSESERNLKAISIAKLYYNVGDYESARQFLAKYIVIRPNSTLAFKLNGQAHEQLGQPLAAFKSFRTAFELDPSQTDLLLKIITLIADLGAETVGAGQVKYWLEQGQTHFPHHACVKRLRAGVAPDEANGRDVSNGLGDGSPDQSGGPHNSSLWSTSLINGGRRHPLGSRLEDTPDRSSTPLDHSLHQQTPRRHGPRPSPERLEAQVRSLEATQNRMVDLLLDQNKQMVEELKLQRVSVLEEMKGQRQNVSELKMEMKQGLHDLKLEVAKLGHVLKEPKDDVSALRELREIRELLFALPKQIAHALPTPPPQVVHQAPSSSPAPPPASRSLQLQELQEALAQQTALLQMSSLGFAANMFTRPGAPPPGGVAPPPPLASHIPPMPTFRHGAEWTPPLGPATPQYNPPEPIKNPKLPAHDYQISVAQSSHSQATSPFAGQEGPALPISTTALLSSVPAPVFSSLSKTHTKPTTTDSGPSVRTETTASANAGPKGFGDQFKPKVGSWECAGCLMRNTADILQCLACETPQPGREAEVKKKTEAAKPQVTFGAQGGFKFGFGAGAAATSTPTTTAPTGQSGGGFVFGGGTPTNTNSIESKLSSGGHLSFENQSLKLNTEQDAKGVADKIKATKPMTQLTLAGNTIGIDAAKAIGKALEVHPEFQKAHWKDMFTGRMKTEIPPALKHLSSGIIAAKAQLVELDLSDNAFGPIGMEGLADLLRSPACFTLKELKLNNTGCGVTGGKLLAKTLMESYELSKKKGTPLGLKVFILGRSRQENEGAKALAAVFKLMGTLEEVVMPQNGIYHEGIAALTDAFGNNPNLRILNMNDNTFTEKGAKLLANVLHKMPKLQVLNLGDCLMKTEGTIHIANALKPGHFELEELHVDSNEIRVEGGVKIIEAVVNKPKLRQLSLDANQFGEKGCEKLMAMLEVKGKRDIVGEEIEEDEEPDSDDNDEDEDEGDDEEEDDYYEGEDAVEAKPPTSIFGGQAYGSSTTSTIFGTPSPSASIFGQSKSDGPAPSIFGQSKPPAGGGGLFGNASSTPTTTSTSIFGGFSFGPPATTTVSSPSGGLAGPFASIGASTTGFSFATPPAGGSGVLNISPKKDDDEEKAAEDPDHDPHFEPIIPLPALVKVTTGEEEEETMFVHRSKMFRFDLDSKQWKERGIGDLKILKHRSNNTYRVLLRREQIHKVACNHRISKDMELKPMSGSQTAVCWFAMDYAEEEAKMEHLAARFKLAETKDEFLRVFEECQKALGDQTQAPSGAETIQNLSATPLKTDATPLKTDATPLKTDATPLKTDAPPKKEAPIEVAKLATPLFGGATTITPTASPGGVFGKTADKSASPSLFGSANTSSIFGNSVNQSATPALFGNTSTEKSSSIFGASTDKSVSTSFFGSTVAAAGTSGFTFGKAVGEEEGKTPVAGIDLSANKVLPSFADVTKSKPDTGFSFNTKNDNFKFEGQGKSVFGKSLNKSDNAGGEGGAEHEHDEHDPHFEPIIPLPELIKITTGEEEEEVIFKHRAKVFRFDPDTKQWKERGIGDMKILKHPDHKTFRVLLRREQIHKVACNHRITKDMELKPMAGSESAVCWFAMDYAEEEAKMEHLAVRFKEVSTKNEFENKIKDCQKQMGESATSPPAVPAPSLEAKYEQVSDEEDGDEEDEEEEENTMFEMECQLSENSPEGASTPIGQVFLRVVYDDDVFGARIMAHLAHGEAGGEGVCNHLIAMQTNLDSVGATTLSWSALDFSQDPPAYRTFQADFKHPDDANMFKDCFNEGKELAEQSEILEMPNELDNPQDYYYGEGGDYESN